MVSYNTFRVNKQFSLYCSLKEVKCHMSICRELSCPIGQALPENALLVQYEDTLNVLNVK
jgi:hypothetical protein